MATARSINVHLRLKPLEAKRWQVKAKRADVTLSEWIRGRCNEEESPPRAVVQPAVSDDQIELPLNGRSRKRAS